MNDNTKRVTPGSNEHLASLYLLGLEASRAYGVALSDIVVRVAPDRGEVFDQRGLLMRMPVASSLRAQIESFARAHGLAATVAEIGLGLCALTEYDNGDAVTIAAGVVLEAARELGGDDEHTG